MQAARFRGVLHAASLRLRPVRGPGRGTEQATKVIVVFHEDSEDELELIERVIANYRESFGGAKVVRSTAVAEVRFYVD